MRENRERKRNERERACCLPKTLFSLAVNAKKKEKKNSPFLFSFSHQTMRLLLGARLKKTKERRGGVSDDEDDDGWKSSGEVRRVFDVEEQRSIDRRDGLEFAAAKFYSKTPTLPLSNRMGEIPEVSLRSPVNQKYIRNLRSLSGSRNARV